MNRTDQLFRHEDWPDRWSREHLIASSNDGSLKVGSLKEGAISALSANDLDTKIKNTRSTAKAWFDGTLGVGSDIAHPPPDRPGRPARPHLVPPNRLKKRSIRSQRGRFALLHAIAHIELNAVDLAWDIVGRFAHLHSSQRPMPRSFYDGWVLVALEEAKHFSMLRERLNALDGDYGDLDAHDGLWEAAQTTDHELTARLAVVPLVLEARGLDMTPSMIAQMEEVGDQASADIFRVIYRDEQGHVAVGAKWFRFLCRREGREPAAAFQELVRTHFRGALKPPFNELARARAGLTSGFYKALSSASR